jgi:heme/copper-type cytochrome/quinol oxidase subunit 2
MHALLANTGSNYFWLPKQASTVAGDSDDLFNIILAISVFFFLLITVLLIIFVIRYRHRPGQKTDVGASHSMFLEITWTIIPCIIVVFLYYYGFKDYMNLAIEPPNSYQVVVNGKMWNWMFTYPGGYADPELHTAVGMPVRCVLESDDVIHSLFIPVFRVKKDVVPGRYNRLWFQATRSDGGLFAASVMIDGKPTMIVTDATGRVLPEVPKDSTDPQHKPLLDKVEFRPNELVTNLSDAVVVPKPVLAALTAPAPGPALAPSAAVQVCFLLNGKEAYIAGEKAIDGNGADIGRSVALTAPEVPTAVQDAIRNAAGSSVSEAQKVWMFDDAEASDIFCAGYCGTNHSTMHSRVIIHKTQKEFEDWLKLAIERGDKGTPLERGQKLYSRMGCQQCHTVDGSKGTGPTWRDMFGIKQPFNDGSVDVIDTEFVHKWLLNPTIKLPKDVSTGMVYPAAMPPFPNLKDKDVDAICAYMASISKNAPATTTQPSTQPVK